MGIRGLDNLKPDDPPRKEHEALPEGLLILFDKTNQRTAYPLMRDNLGRPLVPEKSHLLYIGTTTYEVTNVIWDFEKNKIIATAEYRYEDDHSQK